MFFLLISLFLSFSSQIVCLPIWNNNKNAACANRVRDYFVTLGYQICITVKLYSEILSLPKFRCFLTNSMRNICGDMKLPQQLENKYFDVHSKNDDTLCDACRHLFCGPLVRTSRRKCKEMYECQVRSLNVYFNWCFWFAAENIPCVGIL